MANTRVSLLVAYRLYLPEARSQDVERRTEVGVPEDIGFQIKPEIALDQIRFVSERKVIRLRAPPPWGC